MLVAGELDAVIHSDIIEPYLQGDPNVARLFDDYKAEEERYFKKTGIFPIMHVMGIKREIVEQHPWVPVNLYKAFDKAKAIGMKRMFNPRSPGIATPLRNSAGCLAKIRGNMASPTPTATTSTRSSAIRMSRAC
mgnify:CR=1 FL=1